MAKVQQKSEKITAFGGIFFVLDKFDSILSSVIDSHLGLRSTLIGYQYSEIIRAIFSVFCCGGDCMEDLNLYLKDVLTERPHTRVPSADTVLRGIEELATGQLTEGGAYDVDFGHQFLEADKYDCKRTYKGFDGYSPGVFTIGGLMIAYLENRDGNCNVRFKQAETHRRFFEMMSSFGIHARNMFMRVPDYVRLTGLSRTTASIELRKLASNPSSGITSRGRRSQKYYVLGEAT